MLFSIIVIKNTIENAIMRRFLRAVRRRAKNLARGDSDSERHKTSLNLDGAPDPDVCASCLKNTPPVFRVIDSGLFSLMFQPPVGVRFLCGERESVSPRISSASRFAGCVDCFVQFVVNVENTICLRNFENHSCALC